MGFVGYYRRFIHNFSKISRPLTDLIPAPNKKKKKSKSTATREWKWDDTQRQAFQTLKDHLVSAPILGYASSFLPYELHTDASGDALGAVLYQEQMERRESSAMQVVDLAKQSAIILHTRENSWR